jgi:hypothetical protein
MCEQVMAVVKSFALVLLLGSLFCCWQGRDVRGDVVCFVGDCFGGTFKGSVQAAATEDRPVKEVPGPG